MRLGNRVRTGAISAAIFVALAMVAAAFAGIAAFEGLLLVTRPAIAALLTAIGAGLLALLVALFGGWLARGDAAANRRQRDESGLAEAESMLDQLLDPALKRNARRHPQGAAVGALAIGVIVGCSRSARRVLRTLLRDLQAEDD